MDWIKSGFRLVLSWIFYFFMCYNKYVVIHSKYKSESLHLNHVVQDSRVACLLSYIHLHIAVRRRMPSRRHLSEGGLCCSQQCDVSTERCYLARSMMTCSLVPLTCNHWMRILLSNGVFMSHPSPRAESCDESFQHPRHFDLRTVRQRTNYVVFLHYKHGHRDYSTCWCRRSIT